jgi:Ca2+-binding RTX toxin-like protein
VKKLRILLVLSVLALAVGGPAIADHGNFCTGGNPVHTFGTPNFTGADSAECVGEGASYQNTSGVWHLNGGNDQAYSAGGNDTINGNAGHDGPLQGGSGADVITGGDGDDVIAETGSGQGGSDTSHDELYGNGGADTLYGGGGSDTIICGAGSNDTVYHKHDPLLDDGDGSCENHFHT